MTLMARLERTFGRFEIPNLTLYLVCGQAAFLIMAMSQKDRFISRIVLDPDRCLHDAEWWRLFTFIFYPPVPPFPRFCAVALYFFFIMGSALEANWGEFRYNLYLLVAYLASVAAAFLAYFICGPDFATNSYIGGSVFLAFATLYPEYIIYLFFILPVPIKWVALATWISYAIGLVIGDWMTRLLIIASVLNYLLFFARDLVQMMKHGRRRMERGIKRKIVPDPAAAFHTCATCGINDKTHPKMDFRYCPGCNGQLAYCTDHLHNHQHRAVARKE
jgi:hypothetical protein